jgi:PhnB protein
MKAVNPYLNFDGNAEEAFRFYKSVFGGDFAVVVRFREMGGGPPGTPKDELERIAHIALPFAKDAMLMASDTLPSLGHTLTVGNNYSISLAPESADEAQRLFEGLSAGGKVAMPLQQTAWAEKFGTCEDRFGVHWMVSYAGNVQFVPPRRGD